MARLMLTPPPPNTGPWNHFFFQWFDGLIPPPTNPFSYINFGKVAVRPLLA